MLATFRRLNKLDKETLELYRLLRKRGYSHEAVYHILKFYQ